MKDLVLLSIRTPNVMEIGITALDVTHRGNIRFGAVAIDQRLMSGLRLSRIRRALVRMTIPLAVILRADNIWVDFPYDCLFLVSPACAYQETLGLVEIDDENPHDI